MKIPGWTRYLTVDGWIGIAAMLATLVMAVFFAWYLLFGRPAALKQEAAAARAGQAQAEGAALAGHDAVTINDGAHAAADQSEALGRETADAIRHAPGAAQPLDPDLNRTGRGRLCERDVYRGKPGCMQQSDRAQPAR